jgi:hypothetical protein
VNMAIISVRPSWTRPTDNASLDRVS